MTITAPPTEEQIERAAIRLFFALAGEYDFPIGRCNSWTDLPRAQKQFWRCAATEAIEGALASC